ncbi:MAG: TIGR00341 family protein [Synechococcus sp. NP17]|jgi:uncharacterized hydrophobic protein (TIGR00271 family)|nr:TIGR00341 family protein [Synechococcus sp. NP17]|tara:strand:- start:7002 stop:8117 length:1116 start_codon:yes stop_codon:yes gene_type:complete
MQSLFQNLFGSLSGEWKLNLETQVPRNDLYKSRIASSRPTLGFFLLLICSAVIATLGLISNSSAVVIGAMIVAPLMDPILSLAFGLAISNNKLVKRSAITVIIGVITVIATATLLGWILDASEVNREIYSRTAPNLIDLGIAVAAAIAGSFTLTRDRLSNSIAGVAIAVALVPPLCVCGIGLSMGKEVIAVFGRGSVAGLSNQISEGSFLLFLANLIGITFASLMMFLLQRYGSIRRSWRNLLAWLGLLGLLCIPLASSLHDFSVRQNIDAEFVRFKAGRVKQFKMTERNPYLWKKVKLLYSNVRVINNNATIELVLTAQEGLITQPVVDDLHHEIITRSRKDYGIDAISINISVIPNQIFKYNITKGQQS